MRRNGRLPAATHPFSRPPAAGGFRSSQAGNAAAASSFFVPDSPLLHDTRASVCRAAHGRSERVSWNVRFTLDDPALARALVAIRRRLPPIAGSPIRIQRVRGLRDRRGVVHAGSFLRERRIAFDCARAEFPRVFVHELFHFVWLRAGNPMRLAWEARMRAERRASAGGDLGWSAEWRKQALTPPDVAARSRRWREYCCESFCDSAAWLYSGVRRHGEFRLAPRFRARRREWFQRWVERRELSV